MMPDQLTGRFLAFPGQGSQSPGMGQALVSRFPVAAEAFDEASEALDLDLRALLWSSSASRLTRTENAQPAILLYSLAALRVWRAECEASGDGTIAPIWAAGHSVGALAAAVAVGALGLADAMRLARRRGELMASAPGDGGMLAVAVTSAASARTTTELADELGLDVACYNGDRQLVLSGDLQLIEDASRILGSKSLVLEVSHAFHSRLMDPIVPEWRRTVAGVRFADPDVPYLSASTGQLHRTADGIASDLADGVRKPVRWQVVTERAQSAAAGLIFGNGSPLKRIWRRTQLGDRVEVVDDSFRKDARRAA
ncbi:ACP S-malonyltransferase [Leifsonia sp. McL0607]|uniref:ACP S-malonyltransferase n=1 Tax=Leifsonia sp. McL0607 TaxID=3415672 RepID=UPI003CECC0C8